VHQKELKIKRKFSNRANSSRSAPEKNSKSKRKFSKSATQRIESGRDNFPEETIEDLKIN
jgi:hypothetical protein